MIFKSLHPDVTFPDISLTALVLARAQEMGAKPALIDGSTGRTLTYGQLATAVNQVAASLAQRGFQKGDVFAICSPNLPEYAIAFHAVASLGGIITTVNPLYTTTEMVHQFEDAGVNYLLTVPQFLNKAQEAATKTGVQEIFVFGEAEGATPFATLLSDNGQPPEISIDPRQDLVAMPYSSGTTGLS